MYKCLKLNKRVEKNDYFSSVVLLPHRWQSQLNAAQWRYSYKYKHLPHVLYCLKTDIFEDMQEKSNLRCHNSKATEFFTQYLYLQICRLASNCHIWYNQMKKKKKTPTSETHKNHVFLSTLPRQYARHFAYKKLRINKILGS